MKRIISGVLCSFIACSILSFVSLASEFDSKNVSETDKVIYTNVNDYSNSVIYDYIAAHKMDYMDLYISNIYNIYYPNGIPTNYYVGFLISNEKTIGELAIYEDNNTYYSSFAPVSYEEVDRHLSSNTPVAFIADGSSLAIANEERYEILYRTPEANDSLLSVENCTSILKRGLLDYTSIQLTSLNDTQYNSVQATAPTYSYHNNTPIISNSQKYDTDGQCWASCVASKALCEHLSTWGYLTSDSVYSAVKSNYKSIGSGKERYQRGLAIFCCPANTNTDDVVFSFSTIRSKTTSGNEIIMRMQDTNTPSRHHAVVLEGYDVSNPVSGSTYTIMDPNKPSYVTISISFPQYNTGSNLIYVSSSAVSYKWFDSMYCAD